LKTPIFHLEQAALKNMTKCHYCGTESEIEQAFRKVRPSFRRKFRSVCLQCLQKRRIKNFNWLLCYWLTTTLVSVVFLFFPSLKGMGYFFLNCLLLDLFLLLTILPHEFGHALTAKLVGFRVFMVVVGFGKTFYKKRLLGFNLELKSVPLGGVTILTPKSEKNFKLKYALSVIAGPLVSVIIGWIVLLVMPRPIWPHGEVPGIGDLKGNIFIFITPFVGQGLLPLQIILVANIWILLVNLWPRHINSMVGKIPSDGLLLLKMPFMKREKIVQLLAANYVYETSEAYQLKKYPEAQKWCEEGLVKYPENQLLVNWLGIIFLQRGSFQEARSLFYKQVQLRMADPVQNALALNNLAYSNIKLGDPQLLSEADICSSQAMEKLPWMPAVKGTRGAVLVELGQIQEGIILLRESMQDAESNAHKAENACLIALAEKKRGNREECQRYLDMARTFDPDFPFLKRFAAD
jgi:Tfp pilus assembly protein PilF